MTRLLWILLRFSLSAWVGAATLFVVTGIREVTTTTFDAAIKNQLAALRFPAYYLFGFTLVSLGTAASGILCASQPDCRRRLGFITGLCVIALITMTFDYFRIYLPLERLMLEPEARISPEFWQLHQWSKYINFIDLTFVLVAAMLSVAEPRRDVNAPR